MALPYQKLHIISTILNIINPLISLVLNEEEEDTNVKKLMATLKAK